MIERRRLGGECGYHGDEHRAGRIEFELGVFEDESLLMAGDGTLNQLDLLSHDGQDFQFDTIESRRRWLALKREHERVELTRRNKPRHPIVPSP